MTEVKITVFRIFACWYVCTRMTILHGIECSFQRCVARGLTYNRTAGKHLILIVLNLILFGSHIT